MIILNEEMKYLLKIVKCFEESGLLIKSVNEANKNKAKEQKGRFPGVSLSSLAASLVGNEFYELVKERLEQARMFNATSFFD